MDLDDNVALEGSEHTSAPVAAPAEEAAPANTREAVRRSFELAKIDAAEREEARAAKVANAPKDAPKDAPAATEGEDTGKPTLDRTRDPQGKFLKKEGTAPAPVEIAAHEAPEAVETPKVEAPVAGALKPPPGWNAAARAVFANLPPEVKEAVAKREADVSAGFQQKDQALQRFKGLETYTPMIEGSGLSHAEFTKRAVEWEQSLKTNPVGTLLHVAKLSGIDIVRLAQQMTGQRGGQNPQQAGQQAQQQPYPAQQQLPDFDKIVEAKFAERERLAKEREAHGTVEQFMSDPKHVHAEAVADDMAFYIGKNPGLTLEKAYEMACYANPEIRALLIRQAGATPGSVSETERARLRASEAKRAAKATVGAPSGLPAAAKDTRPADATIRSDVRRAYDLHRAQL